MWNRSQWKHSILFLKNTMIFSQKSRPTLMSLKKILSFLYRLIHICTYVIFKGWQIKVRAQFCVKISGYWTIYSLIVRFFFSAKTQVSELTCTKFPCIIVCKNAVSSAMENTKRNKSSISHVGTHIGLNRSFSKKCRPKIFLKVTCHLFSPFKASEMPLWSKITTSPEESFH